MNLARWLGDAVRRLGPRERLSSIVLLLAIVSAALPTTAAVVAAGQQQRSVQIDRIQRSVDVVQNWFSAQLDGNLSNASQIAALRNIEAAVRFKSQPELRRTLAGLKERTRDDFIVFYDNSAPPAVIEADPSDVELPDSSAIVLAALGGRATGAVLPTRGGIARVAAAPIESEGSVVGAVLVGDFLDARYVGQVRRLTGLETAFIGSDSAVGTLPDWTSDVLLSLIDDRTRLLLSTRDRLVEDHRFFGNPYRIGLTPLAGLSGRPVAYVLLALPVTGVAGVGLEGLTLLWPWVVLIPLWLGTAYWLRRRYAVEAVATAVTHPRSVAVSVSAPPVVSLPAHVEVDPAEATSNGAGRAENAASASTRSPGERLEVAQLVVDRAAHEVYFDGKAVALTRTEFALLWQLASNVGRAQSRDDLINAVWGEDQMAEPAMVDAHIGNLRRKIEPVPGRPSYILTVRGVGYKMVVPEVSHVSV